MPRQSIANELVLELDEREPILTRRLSSALVAAIADGRLADGDPLPSSRVLAADLGLSRAVVVASYEELVASGFLVARQGSATRVEAGAQRAALAGAFATPSAETPRSERRPIAPPKFDALPGYPDTTLIDQRDWSRACRAAAGQVRSWADDVAEIDRGRTHHFNPALRAELADHLRRHRGILCDPEAIFIFPGVNAALRLLTGVLMPDGARIAFEEPGYASARRALVAAGARTVPVPVDRDGFMLDQLPDAAGAYVTPAHQFPLGARLSVSRRADLLAWAKARDALIFEDDYDGEFRYDVPPMAAVRAMTDAPEHVVYLGTASKTIARDLRLAWAIVPERFIGVVREHLFDQGDSASVFSAGILAEFMRSGGLRRQIASIQRVYADRRRALSQACERLRPEFEVMGINAGLHLVLAARSDTFDDMAATEALAGRGLACAPLSYYYASPAEPGQRRGLVCGYSRLPPAQAHQAVDLIEEVLADGV